MLDEYDLHNKKNGSSLACLLEVSITADILFHLLPVRGMINNE